MPRKQIIPAEATTDKEHRLEQLEATIVRGVLAYEERNALIAELVQGGEPKIAVVRRLNRVRERLGAQTLSAGVVAAVLARR